MTKYFDFVSGLTVSPDVATIFDNIGLGHSLDVIFRPCILAFEQSCDPTLGVLLFWVGACFDDGLWRKHASGVAALA